MTPLDLFLFGLAASGGLFVCGLTALLLFALTLILLGSARRER